FTGPPLACSGGGGTGGDRFADLDEQSAVDVVLELGVGEAPLRLEPAAAGGGRLRKRGAPLVDELKARLDGQKVCVRDVPAVDRIALGAPGTRSTGVVVPVAGLLGDRSTVGEDRGLPLDLVTDGTFDGTQGVHVLRFGPGSERGRRLTLRRPRAERNIGV